MFSYYSKGLLWHSAPEGADMAPSIPPDTSNSLYLLLTKSSHHIGPYFTLLPAPLKYGMIRRRNNKSIYRRSNHMTGRLHTCPAPTLSGVGFVCGPFRPGRSQFHNFSTSAAAPDPVIPHFCYPDPPIGPNLAATWAPTCTPRPSKVMVLLQRGAEIIKPHFPTFWSPQDHPK